LDDELVVTETFLNDGEIGLKDTVLEDGGIEARARRNACAETTRPHQARTWPARLNV
jgi:hypothetical protein